ncbi:lipoprotein LpqH [Actinomyces radicidentis]|uniref:lipoprotein LpqH n=1 Tax=Actinomyces radicidentis TaxID=111015 RepID=UPI0028E37A0D|nr:lipoprotein LpqH [Actinomyces radicidentis]
MSHSSTRRLSALGLTAVAALALGACSGSSGSASPSASPTPSSTVIAIGGSFKGTVNDKTVTIPDAGVACPSDAARTTIAVASQSGTAGSSASVVIDADGQVLLADITTAESGPVSYSDGFNVGSAIAEQDGKTWTVRGEGTTSTDASPAPGSPVVPFELTITCP